MCCTNFWQQDCSVCSRHHLVLCLLFPKQAHTQCKAMILEVFSKLYDSVVPLEEKNAHAPSVQVIRPSVICQHFVQGEYFRSIARSDFLRVVQEIQRALWVSAVSAHLQVYSRLKRTLWLHSRCRLCLPSGTWANLPSSQGLCWAIHEVAQAQVLNHA